MSNKLILPGIIILIIVSCFNVSAISLKSDGINNATSQLTNLSSGTTHTILLGKIEVAYDDMAENNVRIRFIPEELEDIDIEFGDEIRLEIVWSIIEGGDAREKWIFMFRDVKYWIGPDYHSVTEKGHIYKKIEDRIGISDTQEGTLYWTFIVNRDRTNPAWHIIGGNSKEKDFWKISFECIYEFGSWNPFWPWTDSSTLKKTIGSEWRVEYPNASPSITLIEGTQNGEVNEEYSYTFTVQDPDCSNRYKTERGDYIGLEIKWGDGETTLDDVETKKQIKWNDGNPQVKIQKTHKWITEGTHTLNVRARDYYNGDWGVWSDWQIFEVTMPKNHEKNIFLQTLFIRINFIKDILKLYN
jgi:hypothetical protein